MANQIAFRVLATAGTAVVAGRRQHVVAYEYGAAARNAGVQFHAVDDGDGMLDPDDVRWARAASAYHQPAVSLVSIENTHMAASGAPWSHGPAGRRWPRPPATCPSTSTAPGSSTPRRRPGWPPPSGRPRPPR